MAVDDKDNIYVADFHNHRIQCFDREGKFLFKFGTLGTENERKMPTDVAFDSKNQRILVADNGNHRIQIFDRQGTFLYTFGSFGDANGKFSFPHGIATDEEGNVFVTDHSNHRVQVFDEKGNFIRSFGLEATGQRVLKHPIGIGILSNGDAVVAEAGNTENHRLSIFNSQGQFVRIIGEDKLKRPHWLSVDSQDNILVADAGTKSVLVFSREGRFLKEIAKGVFKYAFGVVINRKGDIFVSGWDKQKQDRICVF